MLKLLFWSNLNYLSYRLARSFQVGEFSGHLYRLTGLFVTSHGVLLPLSVYAALESLAHVRKCLLRSITVVIPKFLSSKEHKDQSSLALTLHSIHNLCTHSLFASCHCLWLFICHQSSVCLICLSRIVCGALFIQLSLWKCLALLALNCVVWMWWRRSRRPFPADPETLLHTKESSIL